jgi:hypothetical protein
LLLGQGTLKSSEPGAANWHIEAPKELAFSLERFKASLDSMTGGSIMSTTL